ncbi:glycosyltransferase [Desulfosporosinus sp. Sb-LF]|uniref:glycosyltransferase family 2 protein n=1 Tax=Desulfosporosinus sp. Sb-LF TaxID=2560027 RepID=UPI00107F4F91|nr:glycosyltransferase [Desulfosporosinus sp. Sb-LF]TGE33798.1 glycosyltransferase [Desulfosporosinus sp. Sb-LF]
MVEVSVVMGLYNCEKTLGIAIEAILAQTFSNWELIMCDDGSADDTVELVRRYREKDSRIVLLKNDCNHGLAYSLNRCIEIANGKYIVRQDADDSCDPARFAKQILFLREHPEIDFVGTRGRIFKVSADEDSGSYWFCSCPQKKDFLMTLPFVHASIMFRKDLLIRVGGYNAKRAYLRSEDYELFMRIYAAGYQGANINEPLYFIREDDGTYQRRKYRYRWNEFIVKFEGFRRLELMPMGLFYAVKPLIVGLIPIKFLKSLKAVYYKDK